MRTRLVFHNSYTETCNCACVEYLNILAHRAIFFYIVVRISLLEYSKIHEKAYKFIVCEFGGFQNVLRDACVRAIPT